MPMLLAQTMMEVSLVVVTLAIMEIVLCAQTTMNVAQGLISVTMMLNRI